MVSTMVIGHSEQERRGMPKCVFCVVSLVPQFRLRFFRALRFGLVFVGVQGGHQPPLLFWCSALSNDL